jgi:hypothetical protein
MFDIIPVKVVRSSIYVIYNETGIPLKYRYPQHVIDEEGLQDIDKYPDIQWGSQINP